ncbi:MAG: alpha/beta hydrolase [Saprospiraceae bacterium]
MPRPPSNYPALGRDFAELPRYWTGLLRADKSSLPLHRFTTGPHRRQYVLVSDPPEEGGRGYVIYNHGGGWRHGRPEQFLAAARRFRAWGYGCILPSYRRITRYDYSAIRADQIAALRVARRYIISSPDQPEPRLLAAGMSAGGHLTALLALDRGILRAAGWESPARVAVICAGVLSLDGMADTHVIRALAGRDPRADLYRSADPLCLLDDRPADPPRLLILHGIRDGMAPIGQARTFFEQARKKGFPVDMIELAGGHLAAARWLFRKDECYAAIVSLLAEDY